MAVNLKGLKVNVPKANIENYVFTIFGKPKSGKTTLFAKLVEEVYGDVTKGLLIGLEEGFNALKVVAQKCTDFAEFLEVVEQLVDEKDELGFKFIGIDTADVLYSMAVTYVLKRESRKDGKKYVALTDIAWGKGYALVESEISDALTKLKKSGYGLYIISHDTDKTFESRDGVSYNKTTVSLPTKIRNTILNMSDFINYIDVAKEKDAMDRLVDKRYIYFRAEGSDLECGSRFANVPVKVEYDVAKFVSAFENAVLSEFGEGVDINKIKKAQAVEDEKASKEFVAGLKEQTNDELVQQITSKYANATAETKEEVKKLLKENNISSFGEPDKIEKSVLKTILAHLQ